MPTRGARVVEMFTGREWVEHEGPLAMYALHQTRRARMEKSYRDIDVPVRVSPDLVPDVESLPGFIPARFYVFSVVGSERELGRAEVFTFTVTEGEGR